MDAAARDRATSRRAQCALRLDRARAERLYSCHTLQRGERDLQSGARVGFASVGGRSASARSVRLIALRGAHMHQRRLGGFGVVAQRRHRVAAGLEVQRQLGRADIASIRAIALQRSRGFAMELDTSEWADAPVKHLPVQRVPETIPCIGHPRARRERDFDQPSLLTRKLSKGLRPRMRYRAPASSQPSQIGTRRRHTALARFQQAHVPGRQLLDITFDGCRSGLSGHRH